MNDRELLELAAKSIGMTLQYNYLGLRSANQPWDPLEDDGDALRLAVDLGLQITVCRNDKTFVERDHVFAEEDHGDDSMAATRRAITRAAATLAKGEET